MKKSLKTSIVLIVLFFATDLVVFNCLKRIDEKVLTGQGVGKVNHFLSLKDSVNLLVFGSSRALHHVNPKVLDDNSYNMGADGKRLGYSAALISSLNKNEQIILVHIDPKSIYNSEYKGEDILGLLNVTKRNNDIDDFIFENFPKEIYLSKIFKCYVYNGKVLSLIKNFLTPKYNYEGYIGYDPIIPSRGQKQIFKNLIDKTDFSAFKYDGISKLPNPLIDKFINEIKEKCDKNNSKLVFFTSPSLIKNEKNLLLKTKEYFKYNEIQYFDFSSFIDISDINNWKDFTHLSGKGADLFSKELSSRLKQN
ncbi:hypothetical protein EYD45_01245 [Hyunsoonleella flava]|uniref:SGNH/GDSL hydrolase family protein n=1 Tax=Hyunsoonleella flava TaxID=2527939 RepID=A0A4Q9FHJ4_9FLAO|nr:hypothetical protein [Hyunsoonleella flava]TBN06538.1 hypothetical protein EYD45_01245 [Hyunsoonleella flava]